MPTLLAAPVLVFEKLLFLLVVAYDKLVYSPLSSCLSPVVAHIPREVQIGQRRVTIFTANGVTLSRTALVVPVALCLKTGSFISACLLIVLHDFLDHLDGIVAKVQRRKYGPRSSDPLLGGFLDAFCDKVVNVFSLWTILILTDFSSMGPYQFLLYLGVGMAVIGYEAVLGIVRVQDYFKAKYTMLYGQEERKEELSTMAGMEGKTKEKLESMGLALLCLAFRAHNPMHSYTGLSGIICFAISLRFAHASLLSKLRARKAVSQADPMPKPIFLAAEEATPHPHNGTGSIVKASSVPAFRLGSDSDSSTCSDLEEGGEGEAEIKNFKVDKVYTVGCFDLFHRGHSTLLRNMRKLGKELPEKAVAKRGDRIRGQPYEGAINKVIVGIHDDDSYFKLKKKVPIDNTEKRMANVKKYVHQVFVISSTDPSPYIRCCVHLQPGQRALYIRGDDMPQFPGRAVCEELMPVKFLPYTQGVSSTMLRAQLLGHSNGTVPIIAHNKED